MRESLLVEDGITLLSERSTLRKNRNTRQLSSILSTESPAVAMRVRPIPSQKALKVLGDSSCLSPGGEGWLSWLLERYGGARVLSPQRRIVLTWNVVMLAIIGYYLVQTGMLTGWGSSFWQDELTYFYEGNLIFSVFLFGDILLGPLKAYYQNGILVQNRQIFSYSGTISTNARQAIFRRYLGLYFWLDLLSFIGILVPYLVRTLASNYFKLLFICKVISAYDLDKYLMMLVRNRFRRSHFYAMARIVFFMLLWGHWLGVGFFAVDYQVYASNFYGPNTPNYCWVYNSGLNPGHNLTVQHWSIQYLYTLYFSIGNITTIAYGDITARNPMTCLYTIFAMSMSVLLFTYFFKQMIEVIFVAQADDIQNSNSINLIRRYLEQNKVTSRLTTKIRSYFETNSQEQRMRNRNIELDLISKLPRELKEQLNISLFGQFLSQLGLFLQKEGPLEGNKTPFVFQLSASIEFERITAGQVLYREGQHFEEHEFVYFSDPSNGELAVSLGQGPIPEGALRIDSVQKLTVLQIDRAYRGSLKVASVCGLFGQGSFFTQSRRDHWAISNKNIEILKLSRNKLDKLLQTLASPLERQKFYLSFESIPLRCCICNESGHRFSKCHYAVYLPDLEEMLVKMRETNHRENSKGIMNIREEEQSRTVRQNCWKLYSGLEQELLESSSERSQGESQGDSVKGDFRDELALLKAILQERIFQGYNVVEGTQASLDVDTGHLFKLYKPHCNFDSLIESTNSYLKKCSQRRRMSKAN